MLFDGDGLLSQEIDVVANEYTNNNNNNNNNTRNGNSNKNKNDQKVLYIF